METRPALKLVPPPMQKTPFDIAREEAAVQSTLTTATMLVSQSESRAAEAKNALKGAMMAKPGVDRDKLIEVAKAELQRAKTDIEMVCAEMERF